MTIKMMPMIIIFCYIARSMFKSYLVKLELGTKNFGPLKSGLKCHLGHEKVSIIYFFELLFKKEKILIKFSCSP